MSNEFLTKRSIRAGSWLVSYNGLARLAGVVKIGIIARILTPEAFGVFGVAALALSLLETFSETGVEQALIQKKTLTESDVASAYVVSVVRGLGIGLLLFLLAPVAGKFFGSSESVVFIRVIAIAPVIRNLRNPFMAEFRRKLSYRQDFVMRLTGTLFELLVGVVVSLITRNPWGLVASMIAGALVETIVSYYLAPRFRVERYTRQGIKELITFGGWLWLSSILTYLTSEGDDIVVGKMLGVTNLGFYQNAYKIASLPATQLTGAMAEVTYSAFSSIQDDTKRLFRGFKKTFITTFFVSGVISFLIFLLAEPLVLVILGNQWLSVIPVLKILTIYGMVRSLNATVVPVLKAVGKLSSIIQLQTVRLVVLAVLILPLIKSSGLVGAAWAVVISGVVLTPVSVWLLYRNLNRHETVVS